jgi:hypothetical protein
MIKRGLDFFIRREQRNSSLHLRPFLAAVVTLCKERISDIG